jgi:hypothetical protein
MFHVPEASRIVEGRMASERNVGPFGAFILPSPEPGWSLFLIASDGDDPEVPEAQGWEHVSVSARRGAGTTRTPTWKEMAFVKAQCWDEDDVVVEYHPAKAEYVNLHPHVLHLWRHATLPFPTPPKHLVG